MPQRTVLAEINTNRALNHKLLPPSRQRIYGRLLGRQSIAEIAEDKLLKKTTVKTTIYWATTRAKGQSAPRKGRPKSYSPKDERCVIWHARRKPKCTYSDLRTDTSLTLSNNTLRKLLRNNSILNWRSKKRPNLILAVARLRL